MNRTVLLASLMLALCACGGKTDPEAPKAESAAPAAAKQKTVLDDQLKALEKAKAVEQQLQDEKEQHDKDIEANGG
ncbi:MAG: hypothetical protein ACTHK2_12290 [Dokdonella sp.]|uniref:hypothetical protein n=1 Tax=Dokdonella sp. TaxID=2291710 RepID=UPI003F7DB8D9